MTDYRFDAQKARTAALACWGTPANTINQPEPPADGEVAELVAKLRTKAITEHANGCDYSAVLLTRAADLLERLAEPEQQGELIPDRYSGYQKTVYRDGFHAGYRHRLTCARAALAKPEPVGPTDEELWALGNEDFRANCYPTDAIRYARAVLARWGNQS